MRALIARCAVGALALGLAACAGQKPASAPNPPYGISDSIFADSLDEAAYEDFFVEEHARLLQEIGRRSKEGTPPAGLLEARALVSASEEMYLQGRLGIALKLLNDAARNLEPKH